MTLITPAALHRRAYWLGEIKKLSGNFGDDSTRVHSELSLEFQRDGIAAINDHLRLCGAIPESYGHDSSEEKLYSKYTDILLCEAFKAIGMKSLVLTDRGDSADVEGFADSYSFVADAKAFRLSRTAKNQKDFKIQAVHRWRREKRFAMVVCPIYQLPARTSQIYLDATTSNVCLLSYSHLALCLAYHQNKGRDAGKHLISRIFSVIETANPSKDALAYWQMINRTMLDTSPQIRRLWNLEKTAAQDSIQAAKDEALSYLASERERIVRLTHEAAIMELIKVNRIDSRMTVISKIGNSPIMSMGVS